MTVIYRFVAVAAFAVAGSLSAQADPATDAAAAQQRRSRRCIANSRP